MQFLTQAIALVSAPPGSLVYYVLTLFALEAALATAYGVARRNDDAVARRIAIAAGVGFGLRLAMALLVSLAALEYLSDDALIPPVDRGITTATLVLMAWALVFKPPSRAGDALVLAVMLLVLIATVVSLVLWFPAGQQGAQFNASLNAQFWWLFQFAIVAIAIGLLFWRRAEERGLSIGLFAIMGLAVGAHLVLSLSQSDAEGHIAGFVRLAEISALPLFAAIAFRHALRIASVPAAPGEDVTQEKTESLAGKVDSNIALEAAQTLIEIGTTRDFNLMVDNITEGVAKAMRADIVLLWAPPRDDETITCAGGYDLIQETHFDGFSIERDVLGTIGSTIARAKPGYFRLPEHANDLHELGLLIGITETGPSFAAPMRRDDEPYGAVMVFSPYSLKEWDANKRKMVAALADSISEALNLFEKRTSADAELEDSRDEMHSFDGDVQAAQEYAERLTIELHETREQLAQERDQLESLSALVAGQPDWETDESSSSAEDAKLVEEMRLQLEAQQEQGEAMSARISDLETKLEESEQRALAADEHAAHLQTEFDAIGTELETMEMDGELNPILTTPNNEALSEDDRYEVVVSISQDLRQPMSSIVGYTDLLLGEQAGIIGALQRQFLDRIRSSSDRINSLLNDLVRVTALDTGKFEFAPTQVDITGVLEDAITGSSSQFRQKSIALRMDIAENLPPLQADRDSLYEIMKHLFTNAALASREGGEVEVSAAVDNENDALPILNISVRDSGEGIPTADLGRVFSRIYRDDNPLIPGIGDAGIGLSIAKTLVEAHGGRIWVDSVQGEGSTFNVLLPVDDTGELELPAEE